MQNSGAFPFFDRIYKICRISEDCPPQAAQKLTIPPNNLPLTILPLPINIPQNALFPPFSAVGTERAMRGADRQRR